MMSLTTLHGTWYPPVCGPAGSVAVEASWDRIMASFCMRSLLRSILLLVLVGPHVAIASYDCPAFAREAPAKSVWSLSPSQVDVVLALGDSITAAFGAAGRRGGLKEFRGWSWSIGGDENVTTLPNFIRNYNPALTGYSVGHREGSLCWSGICRGDGIHRPKHDVMNAALSGAMMHNVVENELPYLMDEMQQSGFGDFTQTWKVLSLFIGANDLCVACHEEEELSTERWERNLRIVLDSVRDRVPNVLVNVVELFNVSKVYDATDDIDYCRHVHSLLFVECDCAFGPEARRFRERMDLLATMYNAKTREVLADYNRVRNDTFAVSLHPFTRDMDLASFDDDMISDLDCFHPSAKSHALTATALWNSMLTPPDKRSTTMEPGLEPLCPDKDSIFYPGIPSWALPPTDTNWVMEE